MSSDCSTLPEELIQFTRTIDLLEMAGFERLQQSFVTIVGLGGVGCHAAAALARSGVGRIRLVDFDDVTLSSLNRHLMATVADVGRPKAEFLKEHLEAVSPTARIEALKSFYHTDSQDEILGERPDCVIDAIDAFNPKVALLRYAVENNIPLVSSMGAAGKADPTQIQVADISETHTCPLARVVRRQLRRAGIAKGIECVFSGEAAAPSLPPDEGDITFSRGRVRRRLPSLGVIPGIFGYTIAGLVIKKLSRYMEES